MESEIRQLLGYWKGFSVEGGVPRKELMNLKDIPDLLPFVFIMEKVGPEYTIKSSGSGYKEVYGVDITGYNLSNFYEDDKIIKLHIALDHVISYPCIGFIKQYISQEEETMLRLNSIYLPCKDEDENVKFIFGITSFQSSKWTGFTPEQKTEPKGFKLSSIKLLDAGFGVPE